MEKELFPSRGADRPFADRTPRMDQLREEACECGDGGHDHDYPHPDGCGCGCAANTDIPHGGCEGHEGCGADSWGLCEYPLAIVYAPCQIFRGLYDPDTALGRGTLFAELDLPCKTCGGLTVSPAPCRGERRHS